MIMARRNNVIHNNVLQTSDQDTIQLCLAVQDRFIAITGSWLRVTGNQLIPPKNMDKDMLLWRKMVARFRRHDYRNTIDELAATRRIAQWTVDMNNKLRNQPEKKVEWKK